MSYAEMYPDPGPLPERPNAQVPTDEKERAAWTKLARVYNDAVGKLRKHRIACSVDSLLKKNQEDGGLAAADNICLTIGIMVLEDTFQQKDHLSPIDFASFLGGLFS